MANLPDGLDALRVRNVTYTTSDPHGFGIMLEREAQPRRHKQARWAENGLWKGVTLSGLFH